jgi:glycosyltransferase involved in cell wall biosynthesis
MNDPLVSVITSNYNCANYLPGCIDSVLQQSFDSWEHIIVDCGSTDNSRQILESLKHPRLRIIDENFCGVARARNIAIRNARGTFCAILDADDLALPYRLALQVDLLRKNPEVVAVGGDFKVVIMRDRLWKKALLPNNRKFHLPYLHDEIMLFLYAGLTPLMHSTLTFRKSSFDEISGYRETIEKAEDFDLVLRMGLRGRLASVPEQVGIIRLGVTDSHTTRHQPRGRDALYYVFLSILDNIASTNCLNCLQQDIEAWLDGIGKQGILTLQGRWLWNILVSKSWFLSRRAGNIILRVFLRRAPVMFACRDQPWWPVARNPETVLKAVRDSKNLDSAINFN